MNVWNTFNVSLHNKTNILLMSGSQTHCQPQDWSSHGKCRLVVEQLGREGGLGRQWSGRSRSGTGCVTLSLSPLDVERQQFHLGAVQALQVRLERVLPHQLVEGHYAEHGGLPDTALHIVVGLQGERDRGVSQVNISHSELNLLSTGPA